MKNVLLPLFQIAPLPWTLERIAADGYQEIVVSAADGKCLIAWRIRGSEREEAKLQLARLIAAAPELLAACETALEARCIEGEKGVFWMDKRDPVAVELREVIEKVRGKIEIKY